MHNQVSMLATAHNRYVRRRLIQKKLWKLEIEKLFFSVTLCRISSLG